MTSNTHADVAQIILKCAGLKFPVRYVRTETGPRVRTHYFTQAPGSAAPLSNILNRAEDIAFACKVDTCMITREKNEIAIAIPLEPEEQILIQFDKSMHFLLTDPKVKQMVLPILMGQTPTGEDFAIDLQDQPHCLIAGSTGGGKSVFQSEIICGLAVCKSPDDELEMFLVDTKRLDLPLFASLPHVQDIVSDVLSLHALMDELIATVRHRTIKMEGVARNIMEYNALGLKPFKHQVLIIDELADIIELDKELARGEDKDNRRTRIVDKLKQLTQISRAAGIHVIAATQRPSVKIISGDIKANFPMRITFRLPTSTDSRVIVGTGGAEQLLGKGDYLYQTVDFPDPRRGHGAFVSTTDISRIIVQSEDIRRMYAQING